MRSKEPASIVAPVSAFSAIPTLGHPHRGNCPSMCARMGHENDIVMGCPLPPIRDDVSHPNHLTPASTPPILSQSLIRHLSPELTPTAISPSPLSLTYTPVNAINPILHRFLSIDHGIVVAGPLHPLSIGTSTRSMAQPNCPGYRLGFPDHTLPSVLPPPLVNVSRRDRIRCSRPPR